MIRKTGEYSRMKKMDLSQWVVTKFYHYVSCAQDILYEYDPFWHEPSWGDPYIKEVYDHFLKCADAYLNYPKIDFLTLGLQNKTTIEIFNIGTGEKLYITHYDGKYLLGKSVWSELENVSEIGIKKYV